MLGIEEGTVHLDLSNRKLDPAYVRLLAVELESSRATAGVARVDLSGNGLSGGSWNKYSKTWSNGDSNLDGITALSSALPSSKIKELIISNCTLGPKSIAIVASSLATAGVVKVDISGNRLMGLDEYGRGTPDHAGWEALCEVLPKSAIKSFKAAECSRLAT